MQGLQDSGLVQTLKDAGPYTVFVPTEAAFAGVDPEKRQKVLSRGEKLTKVMQYHIVPGFYTTNDLLDYHSERKTPALQAWGYKRVLWGWLGWVVVPIADA